MGDYFIIRSKVREGTRPNKDNVRMYRRITSDPRPGTTYKIPAPPEPLKPRKTGPPKKYAHLFPRSQDTNAVQVWDRHAYTSTIRPGTQFIPVPEGLRCENIQIGYYTVAMFSGWGHPSDLISGWVKDGCYAAPKAVFDDMFDTAHDEFSKRCLDMSRKGWNRIFANAECLDVKVIFKPDDEFEDIEYYYGL